MLEYVCTSVNLGIELVGSLKLLSATACVGGCSLKLLSVTPGTGSVGSGVGIGS